LLAREVALTNVGETRRLNAMVTPFAPGRIREREIRRYWIRYDKILRESIELLTKIEV